MAKLIQAKKGDKTINDILAVLSKARNRTSLMNPGNVVTPPNEFDRHALEALWGTCDPP